MGIAYSCEFKETENDRVPILLHWIAEFWYINNMENDTDRDKNRFLIKAVKNSKNN